ncbi:Uncharacterised protein [Nocardia asteroides]|nr:Uncharacterised protein [Nocardia asteroides]
MLPIGAEVATGSIVAQAGLRRKGVVSGLPLLVVMVEEAGEQGGQLSALGR